jgi:uncharacterized protein YceK
MVEKGVSVKSRRVILPILSLVLLLSISGCSTFVDVFGISGENEPCARIYGGVRLNQESASFSTLDTGSPSPGLQGLDLFFSAIFDTCLLPVTLIIAIFRS